VGDKVFVPGLDDGALVTGCALGLLVGVAVVGCAEEGLDVVGAIVTGDPPGLLVGDGAAVGCIEDGAKLGFAVGFDVAAPVGTISHS
jgi:hypothetical protein